MARLAMLWTLVMMACWGSDAYIMEGIVLERTSPTEIVVAHKEIPGLMPAMTMPFKVPHAEMLDELEPGHRITARLHMNDQGALLHKIRVTGRGPLPRGYGQSGVAPLRAGELMPAVEVGVTGGERWVVGEGQAMPTLLTFLYTTCPMPEFCPAVVARLQRLQEPLKGKARMVAVTIDREGDTPEVLEAFAAATAVDPTVWRFGRVEGEAYEALVQRAALTVLDEGGEVVHALRTLILDKDGRLVERYDDLGFATDRVVSQLTTGQPAAPAGSDGTLSRAPAHDDGR